MTTNHMLKRTALLDLFLKILNIGYLNLWSIFENITEINNPSFKFIYKSTSNFCTNLIFNFFQTYHM